MSEQDKKETQKEFLLNDPQVCPTEMPSYGRTVLEILKLAWLPMVGMLFHPMYTIVNASFAGRLGSSDDEKYLAGFGLGSLTLGILAISILSSFSMAVGTFVAQAKGAGEIRLCRVYLHRQYYLNCFVYVAVLIPLLFVKQIYVAIGQDEEVAALATQYVWTVIPGLFFHTQAMAIGQFANSQKVTEANLYILCAGSLSHLLMTFLFVNVFDWGFTGICIATSLQFVMRFVSAYLVLILHPAFKETRDVEVFTRETITNLGSQISIGFAGLAMGIWGWWAFDVFTLLASYLSIEAISAQTILRSLGLLTFMVPVGFSVACGIMVGQNIGRGCALSIYHYYKVSMFLSLFVGLAQVALLVPFMHQVISVFTDKTGVADTIASAWWIFMIFVVFDTTQGIAMSAIRASGKQKVGAIVTFINYWIVGIPVTLLAAFKYGLGISGIWLGPTLAVFLNTAIYVMIFYRLDWDLLIMDAAKQREEAKLESDKKADAVEPEADGAADEETDDNFKKTNTLN